MEAIIITIGDEILIGQVVDTNSAWLGQKMSEAGIKINKTISIGDEYDTIISTLKNSVDEADLIITTGGLGPTKDDITKKAIADFVGTTLYFHQPTFERIKNIFEKLGRPMSPSHNDQCLMPENAEILHNSMGTAPGMLFEYNGKRIISLPGVPYEMKAIMEEEVLPKLYHSSPVSIVHKTILTCGTGETIIENRIADIVELFPDNIKIAYLPALAQVRLRLTGTGSNKEEVQRTVEQFCEQITLKLEDIVYGFGESSLEKELQNLCIAKGLKVGTAESCTGGFIASKIVSVPGSSGYFVGSIISYANDIKTKVLKVSPDTLSLHGAVSEATVKEMVNGALSMLHVDVAVAVSGIAGPDGGSPDKPVGTIWICAGNREHKKTLQIRAGKDRTKNIEIASIYALDLVRKFILNSY